MARTKIETSLGEWACLGIVALKPAHGFAVASRLAPDGDIGRVWSMSRPNTYRCLDTLIEEGLITPRGSERGLAGGNRTILGATPRGRHRLRKWLSTPVSHMRDVRGELLLKLTLAELHELDVVTLLRDQRTHFAPFVTSLAKAAGKDPHDLVTRWRLESSQAVLAFVDGAIADAISVE